MKRKRPNRRAGVPTRDACPDEDGALAAARPPEEHPAVGTEARLARAQRAARIGVWDWEVNASSVTGDATLYELLGVVPTTALTLKTILACVHPDDLPVLSRLVQGALKKGVHCDADFRVLRPDDDIRWLAGRGEVIRDEFGEPVRMVGVSFDVTAAKQAQEVVHKSEEILQAILETAVDAIIIIDREGTMVAVNRATEKMFGYRQAQLVGRNVKMLMPSPDREQHDNYLARYHKTGEAHVIGRGREIVGQRKDDSTFPADLSVSEVDHLGLYTGIIHDITTRKLREAELRSQYDFNERLIETAQSIILVLDLEARVVRFNSIFEELTGWSQEEAEGRNWFDTFVPQGDRTRIRQLFKKSMAGERTQGNINAILAKNGEKRQIEWNDAPLTDECGNLIGLLCTGTDVSERLRLEGEVYAAVEEEKNRFARELHDGLGGHLCAVSMFSDILSQKLHRGEAVAASEADRIAELTREASRQARDLAHGLYPVRDESGALEDSLKSMMTLVRSSSNLHCRLEEASEPLEFGDRAVATHLYRIVQEAVQNAVKHSGATELKVRLAKEDDGAVLLSITDNGTGFDQDEPAKREGIGLHTMQYRARAIGGTLTIGSGPRRGTRVFCRLPQGSAKTE